MAFIYPSYLEAYQNGKLDKVINNLLEMLKSCILCPRNCKVDRSKDKKGICRTGLRAKVYSFMAHHGEEPPVSGAKGSGTIFFSNCNMNCCYCQNYEFSQEGRGREVESQELAKFMLELQSLGCHNLNLVSPTHVLPQILEALKIAIQSGLNIPLVYNTGGYDSQEVIKLLDGIVDIYLPDMRYADAEYSLEYSGVKDYPKVNQGAVIEMHRQVGIAQIDDAGIMKRGLIIRHLVLPNSTSGTDKIMQFIAKELSLETYISLMSQYLPYYKAAGLKDINRRLTLSEYEAAKKIMDKYGLHNGWVQESFGQEKFAGVNIKSVLKNK